MWYRCASTDEHIEKLQSDLQATKKAALLEMENAKGELAVRRQSQYEVLNQLQVSHQC